MIRLRFRKIQLLYSKVAYGLLAWVYVPHRHCSIVLAWIVLLVSASANESTVPDLASLMTYKVFFKRAFVTHTSWGFLHMAGIYCQGFFFLQQVAINEDLSKSVLCWSTLIFLVFDWTNHAIKARNLSLQRKLRATFYAALKGFKSFVKEDSNCLVSHCDLPLVKDNMLQVSYTMLWTLFWALRGLCGRVAQKPLAPCSGCPSTRFRFVTSFSSWLSPGTRVKWSHCPLQELRQLWLAVTRHSETSVRVILVLLAGTIFQTFAEAVSFFWAVGPSLLVSSQHAVIDWKLRSESELRGECSKCKRVDRNISFVEVVGTI